jgi:hypothetical protein
LSFPILGVRLYYHVAGRDVLQQRLVLVVHH